METSDIETPKDIWDKIDILVRLIFLVVIPLFIKLGAENIAQSLKRGQLIQSVTTHLISKDSSGRDIALITLDNAIPVKYKCYRHPKKWSWSYKCDKKNFEEDPVFNIASVLLTDFIEEALKNFQDEKKKPDLSLEQETKKIKVVTNIMIRRSSIKQYCTYIKDNFVGPNRFIEETRPEFETSDLQNKSDSSTTQHEPVNEQRDINIANIISYIRPKECRDPDKKANGDNDKKVGFSDVKIVYIQYAQGNKQAKDKAEKLRTYLQDNGVLAPEIDPVEGVIQNDIRFANKKDEDAAKYLQTNLQSEFELNFDKLINLSDKGYTVASGQFEIWIKD